MKQIKIGDTLIDVIGVYRERTDLLGSVRDSIKIVLESDRETVANTFTDNMEYSVIDTYNVKVENEDGTVSIETITEEFDKSEYCLSCDIVDHRNDIVSIYMGAKTNEELAIEQAEETEQLLYELMFGME